MIVDGRVEVRANEVGERERFHVARFGCNSHIAFGADAVSPFVVHRTQDLLHETLV